MFSSRVSEKEFPINIVGDDISSFDISKLRSFSIDSESAFIAHNILIGIYDSISFLDNLSFDIYKRISIGGYSQNLIAYSTSDCFDKTELFRITSNGLGHNILRYIKFIGVDEFKVITDFSIDEVLSYVRTLDRTIKIELMRRNF